MVDYDFEAHAVLGFYALHPQAKTSNETNTGCSMF